MMDATTDNVAACLVCKLSYQASVSNLGLFILAYVASNIWRLDLPFQYRGT